MESTKILKGLRKLSTEHRKRFGLYLQSPYFNRSKTFIKAFKVLSKFVDQYPTKKLSKEAYWNKVFGKEAYKEINLRKLNSDLLRIFKDFLAQEQYRLDSGQRINYLMKSVHEWGIDSLQSIAIRQSDKFFAEAPYRNANYYLQKYTKERAYHQLVQYDKKREAKSNVDDVLENLDLFYLTEKLYFYTSSIVRSKILSHDYKLLLIKEILETISHHQYQQVPVLGIYFHLAKALENIDDETHYKQLRKLIDEHIQLFPPEEANQIYTGAQNFAIARLNQGDSHYNQEYFDIIEQMTKQNALLEIDGFVAFNKFRNACRVALRLKKFEWTEWFIKEYGDKLEPNVQESTINFSLASLYFAKKEFDKVIPLLSIIEYGDVAYGLAAKIKLAQTYYELGELDVLESHIDALKVFLNRRKDIGTTLKFQVTKYYRYLSRLIRLIPGDTKKIEAFCDELKADTKVLHQVWFIEKTKELR